MSIWSTPKYPGDTVRIALLIKGEDVGDIRIQHYGEKSFHVCAFTPGYETIFPGDSPKMNPDKCEQFVTVKEANDGFSKYLNEALKEGWELFGVKELT